MGEATRTPAAPTAGGDATGDSQCYLYGVVPATMEPAAVDGDLGTVTVLPYQQIAALTGPAPERRWTRRHMVAHAALLDRVAATGPVLPMRFGTVLPSLTAVTTEVLAPHHDSFATALESLTAKAQFAVRARYVEDAIVRELLAEQPLPARLRQRLGDRDAGYADRLRIGEILARAVTAKREADSAVLVESLRTHAAAIRVRISSSIDADRIADVTCLVEARQRAPFESAVEELGRRWHGRARLRMLGPMAAYEFVDGFVSLPAEVR